MILMKGMMTLMMRVTMQILLWWFNFDDFDDFDDFGDDNANRAKLLDSEVKLNLQLACLHLKLCHLFSIVISTIIIMIMINIIMILSWS